MSNKSCQESPPKIKQFDNSLVYNVSINYSIDDTPSFIDDSNSENSSSDEMEIVITESPKRKKEIDLEDKKVLENIEEEIDKQLDEKAAKSNLTATNVKNILKHVISNEHVLAMVRHTVEEGDSTDEETFVYEPKLTRAKAKELYEKKNVINPWVKPLPKTTSEVNVLINEDLPEDSDDDEYLPNDLEESEDDKDRSDVDSQPSTPQTPLSQTDCATQTNWSEDGMFKIPDTPTKKKETENIALRTRSKLSLSDTPLEKIEEAFIPPDITTDMYDLECDDEDWKDFLNKFTKPLDEAVQGQPEDDDDPEYNVLADEDIEIVDHEELHEELREDKAVKVTKKELNELVSELFDYNDLFLMNNINIANESNLNDSTTIPVEKPIEISQTDKVENKKQEIETFEPFITFEQFMTFEQEQLLQQQLRQHVQLTTQHFLQTYQHPEYSYMAKTFKEFLVAFEELGKYKTLSSFHIINLAPALELIQNWEIQHENNDPEIVKMQEFVIEDINRIKNSRKFREKKSHLVSKHAPHLMKTVSNSCVFLYPELLPSVPFRVDFDAGKQFYIPSENKLIALGLEQFESYVQEEDQAHITKFGKVRWADAAYFISKYIMPHKNVNKLYRHIKGSNEKNAPMNPIKYYVQNNKAPSITHNIITLETLNIVPPCERHPDDLPYVWSKFIHTKKKEKREKQVSESKKESNKTTKEGRNKKKTAQIPDLSEHYLIQDVNNPRLFNIVPIEKHDEILKKISKPDIVIESNNNNNKRKRSSEDINISDKIAKTDNNNIRSKTIIKYEHCDNIDIEETDLSFIKQDKDKSVNNPVLKDLCNISLRHCERLSELIKIASIFVKKDFLSTSLSNIKFNSSIFNNLKKQLKSPSFKTLRVSDNMLPSMPFLLTPIKTHTQNENESPEKEKDLEKDKSDDVENNEVTDSPEEVSTDRKDDEDELHALMIASSTIQKSKKLPPTNSEKRKSKIQREYNATLTMLSPENPNTEEEKANNFAQAYFDKVHERLENENPCTYQKFMEILSEYDSSKSICELWEKIQSVLTNHADLCEEFLTFLTPVQAKQIGKLVPHFLLSNMSLFLRKLEIYFNNQPAQLRKIYNSLTELANTPDVKIEQVKGTILPLLKGNVLLIDWFLQMFPSETPPESMLNVWETVQCDEENFDSDNEPFETITLPETDDPYGGPNCICDCHKKDDEMYSSRARHCIPCGTKGRVYVQTGKGLRLANVTFNNSPNTDHNKRLSAKPTQRHKRKSETSPSKTPISPTKEDEPRHSTESEDDINLETNKTSKKTFKNTSPRARKRNRPTPRTRKLKTPKETISRRIIKSKIKKNDISETIISDQTKETTSETENDNITSKELESETENADYEVKSPERSTESADTCEESSQDTIGAQNSDSDISIAEIESVSENSDDSSQENNDDSSWTRQEDKVILQMFKEYGDGEHIYKNIQQVLSNRTVVDIRQRFRLLLSLLQEMSHV